MDKLSVIVGKLKLRDSNEISESYFDKILESLTSEECEKAAAGKLLVAEGLLPEVHHYAESSDKNVMKAAKLVAELAKTGSVREECVKQDLVKLFSKHLMAADVETCTQVCRALGNICYDNDIGRDAMDQCGGLDKLLQLLGRLNCDDKAIAHKTARMMACGCLLNLTNTNEILQEKALNGGALDLMNDYLVNYNEDDDLISMVLMTIGSLVDSDISREKVLNTKLPANVVKLYDSAVIGEVEDAVLELLASLAESEALKVELCKTSLIKHLLISIQKQQDSKDDDDQQVVKSAADLVILLLTGGDSMTMLYNDGEGEVFLESKKWLQSTHPHLRVCGALAIGNFARNDIHCTKLVNDGTTTQLLDMLDDDVGKKSNVTLLHAVLSALRNIAIPVSNKPIMVKAGIVEKVLKFVDTDASPVQFKLLGLLRMSIDGQEDAARSLGTNKTFVEQLVKWCAVEEHAGVKGEANRLAASLVKNSASSRVMDSIIQSGGLKYLVSMATSEHTVMQNEALVALNLLVGTVISSHADNIKDSDLIPTIMTLLADDKLVPEILSNTLVLVKGLHASDITKEAVQLAEIPKTVQNLMQHSNSKVQTSAAEVLSTFDQG